MYAFLNDSLVQNYKEAIFFFTMYVDNLCTEMENMRKPSEPTSKKESQ